MNNRYPRTSAFDRGARLGPGLGLPARPAQILWGWDKLGQQFLERHMYPLKVYRFSSRWRGVLLRATCVQTARTQLGFCQVGFADVVCGVQRAPASQAAGGRRSQARANFSDRFALRAKQLGAYGLRATTAIPHIALALFYCPGTRPERAPESAPVCAFGGGPNHASRGLAHVRQDPR